MLSVALGVSAQPAPSKTDIYAIAMIEAAKRVGEKTVVVSKKSSVDATYPDHVDDIVVEVLTDDQLIARSNQLKKEFWVLSVQPAQARGSLLEVSIVQHAFSATTRRRLLLRHGIFIGKEINLRHGLSGWFNVFFALDPATQEFRVVKVETGGI